MYWMNLKKLIYSLKMNIKNIDNKIYAITYNGKRIK